MNAAYVFQWSLLDFLRLKRLFVWLLIVIVLGVLGKVFLMVYPRVGNEEAYSLLSTILVFRLLPLASAIFSTAVLAQEVEQKTIVYLLTRPIPRATLIAMRTLASVVVVALISTLAALAISVAVYGSGALANPIFPRDFVAIFMGAMAYGTLFVLVSLWANRAMIINLLFAFAWETSVPQMPGNNYWLSISSYLTAIAQRPSSGTQGVGNLGGLASNLGSNTIPPATGWAVAILLIAIFGSLGAWWFTKFEYLPREDAE